MKVSVVGTGYVGLVSGTCFAEMGHHVVCIDLDHHKINKLQEGKSPIYEPGLDELLKRNIKSKRLKFSTGFESVKDADTIFLAVGTPSDHEGRANLEYLKKAAISVALELKENAIVVIKSTVPVGTCEMISKLVSEHTSKKYYLVNNPEFLKEGSAIEDFMRPDRVVIGCKEEFASRVMQDLYAPLVRQGNPIYIMSNISAEFTKYAANCFLATKISFINEMSRLCELTGADIEEVRRGITSDARIGKHFLYAGPGYGGSCFPKDVKALMSTSKDLGMDLSIVRAAEEVNNEQKILMAKKIKKHFSGKLQGRKFSFWGVAFKPNTDDVREAPAISMAEFLCSEGAEVHFYDPVANENFYNVMEANPKTKGKTKAFDDKYDSLSGCDGVVLMTEWKEFRFPEFDEIKKRLNFPNIFDARNIYNPAHCLDDGLNYYGIGKLIPKRTK